MPGPFDSAPSPHSCVHLPLLLALLSCVFGRSPSSAATSRSGIVFPLQIRDHLGEHLASVPQPTSQHPILESVDAVLQRDIPFTSHFAVAWLSSSPLLFISVAEHLSLGHLSLFDNLHTATHHVRCPRDTSSPRKRTSRPGRTIATRHLGRLWIFRFTLQKLPL